MFIRAEVSKRQSSAAVPVPAWNRPSLDPHQTRPPRDQSALKARTIAPIARVSPLNSSGMNTVAAMNTSHLMDRVTLPAYGGPAPQFVARNARVHLKKEEKIPQVGSQKRRDAGKHPEGGRIWPQQKHSQDEHAWNGQEIAVCRHQDRVNQPGLFRPMRPLAPSPRTQREPVCSNGQTCRKQRRADKDKSVQVQEMKAKRQPEIKCNCDSKPHPGASDTAPEASSAELPLFRKAEERAGGEEGLILDDHAPELRSRFTLSPAQWLPKPATR